MGQLISGSCNPAISAAASNLCSPLLSGPNFVEVPITGDLSNVPSMAGDNVQLRADTFEALVIGGPRTSKIFADAPLTNVSFVFAGYEPGSGEYYADYTVTWTSAATNVLFQFAGHLAVSHD